MTRATRCTLADVQEEVQEGIIYVAAGPKYSTGPKLAASHATKEPTATLRFATRIAAFVRWDYANETRNEAFKGRCARNAQRVSRHPDYSSDFARADRRREKTCQLHSTADISSFVYTPFPCRFPRVHRSVADLLSGFRLASRTYRVTSATYIRKSL